jgi:hypothetical protein
LRQRIASQKFVGHKIIPIMMKTLHGKTRGLKMSLVKWKPYEAELTMLDNEKREQRYPVDLQKITCSCRQR